jgi:serine/threonine protein kinase
MAPEQLQNAASAGPVVDVYALGAVLYECLSGAPPLHGNTVQELMFKILNEQPPRLERRRPGVPKGLADAVERAMAKSPTERFTDVRKFAAAIAPYAELARIDELDPRSATVDLEPLRTSFSSGRRSGIRTYVAIALSGIVGLGVGTALRAPVVTAPASSRSEPASSGPPRASAVAASALPAEVPSQPKAALASVPASSSVPPKGRESVPMRRTLVLPRSRFDSENPYGR